MVLIKAKTEIYVSHNNDDLNHRWREK